MNWKNLHEKNLCHRVTPSEPPLPIILSGVRNGGPWIWTGVEGHIHHYKRGELIVNGRQATIKEGEEIVAWIAPIDDTPEIADPEAFKMQAAALLEETKTIYFQQWLGFELEAIAGS